MEKVKAVLKKIFFLPPLATVLLVGFGVIFLLVVVLAGVKSPLWRTLSYIVFAYALAVGITGLRYWNDAWNWVQKKLGANPLIQRLCATPVGQKYLTDVRFRVEISLFFSVMINLLYIVMKLISGIIYRSTWFIALAIYYALLAAMRILLVQHVRIQDRESELRRYRLCGCLLLIMNQALAGIVVFMVTQNRGFNYPGLLIYAMAFYSVYAVVTAIVNMVKTRRYQSPILSAAKAINLVAALVSLLSLETAMLARFAGNDSSRFRRVMLGVSGGIICSVDIAMAVFMIWRANKSLKNLRQANGEIEKRT